MPESFFELGAETRRQILTTCAARLGRRDVVLEKDIWVCWALKTVFSIPGRPAMVFKGGTSLSKVHRVISRFSEDLDITLGFRTENVSGFEGFDPLARGVSKNKITKYGDALQERVAKFTRTTARNHVVRQLRKVVEHVQVTVNENGDTIELIYPTVFDPEVDDYLKNRVLIEFGGRNVIVPNDEADVAPDISGHVGDLILPSARVLVLGVERTFWEKATLAHFENNRPEAKQGKLNRLSRHWYDIWRIAGSARGKAAVTNRPLLADVVAQKKLFFNSSFADYDACLARGLRLVPDGTLLDALRADFSEMVRAGMFDAPPPSFDEILAELKPVQDQLNA